MTFFVIIYYLPQPPAKNTADMNNFKLKYLVQFYST